MNEDIKEQFWQQYAKLPRELQEAIFSVDIANAIYKIAKDNDALDQLSTITWCIGDVLLGFSYLSDFKTCLKQKKVDQTIIENISPEINEKIFQKLKFPLNQLHGMIGMADIRKLPTQKEVIKTMPQTQIPPRKDTYREMVSKEEQYPKFKRTP